MYYGLVFYKAPLISDEDRASAMLMPLPASLEFNGNRFEIDEFFHVKVSPSDPKIDRAVAQFMEYITKQTGIKFIDAQTGRKLEIDVLSETDGIQQVIEDESYELNVSGDKIKLNSSTGYGTLRGLETLQQLLITENGQSYIPTLKIDDRPRFPWRGLMIDVSRHWIPKEVILRNIDAMAAVKLNVLHLHLSDDQGFRMESKVFPKLHESGSNGKYFTQDDMKEIITFASDRGIRIVPEFDMPGHTESWLIAYPEYGTTTGPFSFGTSTAELFSVPMDPSKEELYTFLDAFVEEMAGLFPDPYFHIGGDEVNPKYWDESESVRAFMDRNNLKDGHDLQAYFNFRMNEILKKHGKKMIGWEEILHPDLGDDVVIQSWKSQKSLFEGVQSGGTAILSAGYYLDHKLPAGKHYSIDPLVLPGAVDITPDTANWVMYDLKMEVPGNVMETSLVIFNKDPNNIFGYLALLDDRTAFTGGTIEGEQLTFDLSTPMGELTFNAFLSGDSIDGHLAFGLLKFKSWGNKSGGSDIPGTKMPEIEITKPLTVDEQNRILGGEAAMWSEVVSAENIDSRIWPRTAAMAEKWWSPAELTTDAEDMYRRLEIVSGYLADRGVTHKVYYPEAIRGLVGDDGYEPLKVLMDVLEETKYYDRLATIIDRDTLYFPDMVLDGVADAARPESPEARLFNKQVDLYLLEPADETRDALITQLAVWKSNHEQLLPFISGSEKLEPLRNLSSGLALLSVIAIQKLSNSTLESSGTDEVQNTLDLIETGENGVLVAVAPGIRKLLME